MYTCITLTRVINGEEEHEIKAVCDRLASAQVFLDGRHHVGTLYFKPLAWFFVYHGYDGATYTGSNLQRKCVLLSVHYFNSIGIAVHLM